MFLSMFNFSVQNLLDALPNIGLGYGGIFVVTAIIVLVVTLLNVVPEKMAERKRRKEAEEDED